VKEGWQVRTLGEICDIARGGSPRPIQKFLTERPDGINWVKIGDATASTKFIYKTEEKIIPEGAKRSRLVKPGDFLLSNSMSFGRPYIMRTTGCIHDGWLVLSDKTGLFDQDYLYYFLGSAAAYKQFDNLAAGATVRNLNTELVKRVTIPLPPLPEQRRIVAILDEAFAGLATTAANAEKNLNNARELFDSVSKSLFQARDESWQRLSLEALLDLGWIVSHLDGNHGNDYPRKEEFISSGVPYLSANCLENDSVNMSLAKFLSPQRAASLRKGVAQNNDVLFAHNATVGPVAMLYTAEPKVILSTSLTYYRCHPSHIAPEYLAHYMRSPEFKAQYEAVMRQSTRNQVPITKQREFFHVIPPLDEQRNIAKKLDQVLSEVRRLEELYFQRLSFISDLKQSILQNAFSGELTLRPSGVTKEAAE
jgi:type I restriction enzyme S subunit